MLERVRREVLEPAIRELAAQGAPFQGVLYAGLMLAADGTLAVLEFNSRFGDPEAQALLPLLPGVTRHLADIAGGSWRPRETTLPASRAAVATVLAASGYPEVPELPEVETIVRELAPRLEGYRIARARLAKTDVLRRVSKPRLLRTLRGNTIEEVIRRAKHAVFRLSSGHRLIVQPRMTGSLVVYDRALTRDEAKYAVLICTIDDGRLLVYRDVRRLGTLWLLDERGWGDYTRRIGPEPQRAKAPHVAVRSEEHTSELQSPCNLVCRLLLEKKKKRR